MSTDDTDGRLERLVRDALAARATGAVGDDRMPPPLSLTEGVHPARARRRVRFLAPLSAAAAVLLAVGLLFALRGHGTTPRPVSAGGPSASGGASAVVPATTPTAPMIGVHVSLGSADGAHVGVGMPVIATFSKKITDGRAFAAATSVTVNGTPARGAWYFEYSDAASGHPMEAHYRLQDYWPAHAKIHVSLPVAAKSAGAGLAFDDNLTLDFTTGAAHVATVSEATHLLTVTSDGTVVGSFPVSLGAPVSRTRSGTKVIMEKGKSICMTGPGYSECGVADTQRLTYDGEYLHAAPWNTFNITHGIDSSNGCTNLHDADAKKLYDFLEIGDVVNYPNASGPRMSLGEGYGDWNLSWQQWQTGGMYATH